MPLSLPRRRLRGVVAATAVGGLAALAALVPLPAAHAADGYALDSKQLKINFGTDGSIQSLKVAGDLFDTDYVMNPTVAPDQGKETNAKYRQWLGSAMFSYALGDGAASRSGVGSQPWKTAWTTESADGRTVTSDGKSVTVTYQNSTDTEGIKDFTFVENYSLASDGSMVWKQTVTNTSGQQLTLGDWGIPIPGNELWKQGDALYETRVVTHSHIGDDTSYVTLQRPSGLGPFVMINSDGATGSGFEYQDRWRTEEVGNTSWAWNSGNEGSNIKGLNVYYPHSMAIQKTNRGYLKSTALALAPGASQTYSYHISKVADQAAVHSELYRDGLLDATAVPGMVVPYNEKAQVALRVKGSLLAVRTRNRNDLGSKTVTNPTAAFARTNGAYRIYSLSFTKTQLGANDVIIYYKTPSGATRSTTLQFYVIDKIATLLDTHAAFMVNHTQWKPGADHLADGDVRAYTFDDWMMNAKDGALPSASNPPIGRRNEYNGYWGLGDDWGLPHGEFLAEKNVQIPVKDQVAALDKYLNVAVWQNLMGNTADTKNPTFTVYDFWEQGKPGSLNTTPAYRGYAYPHVYNTFFSMYQIAKQNPKLISYAHPANWYLEAAYGIFKQLYDGPVAYNWHTGLMGELTTPALITALRSAGYTDQANDVVSKMATKYANFSSQKYPYGSEYSYDNTGEEAVYTLARLNADGDRTNALRMMRDIVAKTSAARGQNPVWFQYSDPVTITGENWWQFQYSVALAGYTLDDYLNHSSALETGSRALTVAQRADLARLNYAGKTAGLSAINSGQISNDPANVGASAWTYQAERGNLGTLGVGGGDQVQLLNGWRGMTGESDLSLWGSLQTLSSDVVTNDPIFGVVGYGGIASVNKKTVSVVPTDGVGRRLNLVDQRLSVDLGQDRFTRAVVATAKTGLTLTVANVAGDQHRGSLSVSGLAQGTYAVQVNGKTQSTVNAYVAPKNAGNLQPPVQVSYSVPAGKSYTVVLVKTTVGTNKAPKANAGQDQTGLTLGLDPITLSGTITDDGLGKPNGTLTGSWSTVSSPTGGKATFDKVTSMQPTVTVTKAGTYVFRLTASDGALTGSDTVSVSLEDPKPLPAVWVKYGFDSSTDGKVADLSGNGNDLTLKGTAAVATDGTDKVLELDASDGSYGQLPDDILTRSKALTISMRVKVDRVQTFDRLFDFGSGTQKYLFLTPKLADGHLGAALTVAGNGAESQITTQYSMTPGTWTDLKLTFSPNTDGTTTGVLYADGVEVGRNNAMPISPKDIGRTSGDYLGKSQFPDPYLPASFDSFEIDGEVT